MPKECRSESSRQSARTGHPAQIAMARAACSRARPTSAVSGNHSSGSRHEVAHRACRYTRPNSSRSFGSPDRYRTGRSETVTATGCTSCRARFRSSLIGARPARIPDLTVDQGVAFEP